MIRYLFLLITLICLSLPKIYSQEKTVITFHPFSGAIVFSAEAGGSRPYTDFSKPATNFFGRGLVEYYFSSKSIHAIGIRFLSGGGFISGEGEDEGYNYTTSIFFMGGGIAYALRFGKGVPYASATVSYLRFDPRDKNGNFLPNNKQRKYDPNAIMYSGELGIRFPLEDVLSLNLGCNINFTNTDYLDDVEKGLHNDAFLKVFVGISLYVGAQKDADGDGIEDSKDVCPFTPMGLKVDEFGCPLDTDNDGVPDYLDKCENTPKNILIDETGCPIDSDRDGVPNYLDKCPDTPQDMIADTNGCSESQRFESVVITTDQPKEIKEQEQILIEDEYNVLNEKIYADMFYSDGKLYCFQLSSFQKKYAAEEEANSLRKKGHKVFVNEAIPFNDGKVWFRVRIGYFNTWEEARAYKDLHFK